MYEPFATVSDVEVLWRALSDDEKARVEAMLPLLSDTLRQIAYSVNKDLDDMILTDATYSSVLKLTLAGDIIPRVLRQSVEGEAMSQESQSALGYSWSGTYAIPGGGVANAIMNTDLKRLGLLRQRLDSVVLWGSNEAETVTPIKPYSDTAFNLIGGAPESEG